MESVFLPLVVLVFLVIALNFFFLMRRMQRDRVKRPSKKALEEEQALKLREAEVRRRLEYEKEEAEEFIEKRNRTFELFEQVRRDAAAAETQAAENQTKKSENEHEQ